MRSVRFVHAADLHLDAPFQGVEASDPRVRAALIASTFEGLDRIVSLCVEERVDFLLIAGDVYNSRDKSLAAQLRFQRAAERLAEAGIPVYIAQGNHDPADGWSLGLRLPETVHYFSTREVEALAVERDGEVICTLYGRGYQHAAETRDLAAGFHRGAGDRVAIGVLHTNVGGREGFENYAPASLEELRAAGMDYWALGHIHKPDVVCEQPAIVYAGCPQGLNPKEDGLRGCYLVEVSAGHAEPAFRPTCSIVWDRREVDVSACGGIEDVRDAVRSACDDALRDAGDRPVVVRLELSGRSEAHAALVRGAVLRDLVADLREERLAREPWVWVDRVLDRTSAALDIERLRESQDFTGDLVRLVDDIARDPEFAAALVGETVRPIEGSVGARDIEFDSAELLVRARDIALDLLEGEAR